MQKYILTTLLRLSALILTGCTTTYTMTTRTGEVIETQGKPEVDATSGMTKYADAYGYHRIVSTSEIGVRLENGNYPTLRLFFVQFGINCA
ncbi:YgdI/YgdR family lipoprotein [Salmonella enterica]|nr:YgdI/YgdR family lipoprotein [Salmonella enterica]ELC3719656.1 YgdI/YgdR family lipoprotein [Salmonella enterica]